MAINPFEHVLDSPNWEFSEGFGLHWYLPAPLSKYMVLELVAAVLVAGIYIPLARRARSGELPRGWVWNMFECLLTFVREKVAKPCLGEHDADRYLPFLWTQFLFILFCNLLGMFPFLGSPTASISVTAALALITFLMIHGCAVAKMGMGHYLKSYIPHVDVPPLLAIFLIPMITVIEVFGNIIKGVVLALRLFANMLAGHTVLAVILLFIVMARETSWFLFWPITFGSVLFVVALSLLELFVAFLQAYVFTFLTSLFLGMTLHPQH